MKLDKSILVVEDDMVDAMTVKRALDQVGSASSVVHMSNGEEALEYLRSDINKKPWLILLDLNMPKMNGLEFLNSVKEDPLLNRIPIVVLTTSKNVTDISISFGLSVAGYMTKPLDYDQFVEKVEAIQAYWAINRLPGESWED